MTSIIVRTADRDPAWFAARMTNVQFEALATRLDPRRLEPQVRALAARRRMQRGASCDVDEVSKWLVNGWSTEQLLATNAEHLSGDALRHSLHWAFPQAYYSVFAVTLAYFKAIGYTETSHAAVIRKFGNEALAGRYPGQVACTAVGTKRKTFAQLAPAKLETSLTFAATDDALVDGQIAQFLSATRDIDLQEKKKEIPIKTRQGTRKKAFSAADWSRVAESLGPTSILSLLYRKRIKANYRDIDSFLHEEIDADALYENLLRIAGALNFVHEVYLGHMLTCDTLERILSRLPDSASSRPRTRLPFIRTTVIA